MKEIKITSSYFDTKVFYKNDDEVDFWLDQQEVANTFGAIEDYVVEVRDVVDGEVQFISSGSFSTKQLESSDISNFNTVVNNLITVNNTVNASDIHITFGGAGYKQNYWEFKKKSYYVGCRFYFAGTEVIGTPASVKIIAYMRGRYRGTVQLYDYTNRKVISEIGVQNIIVFEKVKEYIPQILTCPDLQNVPHSGALLEVRAKSDGDDHRGYLNSLTICF